MESSNLTDAEFKALVIKMFNELRGRVDELYENFNRDRKHKNGDRKPKQEPVRNDEYND